MVKNSKDSQPSDIQQDATNHRLEMFRSAISRMPSTSSKNYHKALQSFSTWLAALPEGPGNPTQGPARWCIAMWLDGHTPATITHYLSLISPLDSSTPGLPIFPPEAYAAAKEALRAIAPQQWQQSATIADFRTLLKLTPLAGRLPGTEALYSDLLLLTLLTPGATLESTARLRRTDLPTLQSTAAEIAARHANPRRRYLLPLGQADSTPAQLRARLSHHITLLLRRRGIAVPGSPEEAVAAYRAIALLLNGADPATILAPLPILSLLHHAPESPRPADADTNAAPALSQLLCGDAPQWYAMKLRPLVTFEGIERRLAQLPAELPHPELYYPAEEIASRVGKKLIFKARPFIRDIIFFRARAIDIRPLFHRIGDLAWCYTRSRRGSATGYAAITPAAMARFQRTIGQFTPDIEVAPAGELTLRPGQKVKVLGGLFAGLEGELTEVLHTDADTIYRVSLLGETQTIEWRLADPRLLAPRPPEPAP